MLFIDHDIVADYLAAGLLAKHWKNHINQIGAPIGLEAWVFAASKLQSTDKSEFLEKIIHIDLLLAAHCTVVMGVAYYAQIEAKLFTDIDSGRYLRQP